MTNRAAGRPPALDTWTVLATAASAVRTDVSRQMQQQAGLTLPETVVLCRVAMAPDAALRMADLADMLGVAKSAITKTVDRLEARGWLQRERDDHDRRGVHAVVTTAGMDAFRQAQPVFTEAVSGVMLQRLAPGELQQLQRLLHKLVDRPQTA
jgi:DNA-binding MarR family transcriptional regulator